ncbi:MAG: thermonuclease family protein [Chloroflexota bacterium]|nr:thermonuclease family protein [Chloroflexota bacterium]
MLHGRLTGDSLTRRSPLRPRVRRVAGDVIAVSLALTMAGCGGTAETSRPTGSTGPTIPTATARRAAETGGPVTGLVEEAEVVEVIDGDTLRVRIGGQIDLVRLTGIDTPEVSGPYRDAGCFGDAASELAAGLVPAGSVVALERDTSDRDQFDRLLRYVWIVTELPNGDEEVRLLNEALVRDGYALARTYTPTIAHQDALDEAERAAIRAAAGMWLTCDDSVSLDPALEDDSGPDRTPIDTTRVPPNVEADAACALFDTFQEAQDLLDLYPELTDILDPDSDGLACEGWFGGSS